MSSYQDIAVALQRMRENALDQGSPPRKMSQRELAARLGVSSSNITQTENWQHESRQNTRRPDMDRIKAWAEACGYRADLAFFPAQDCGLPILERRIRELPPGVLRAVSLLAEVGSDTPAVLIEDLTARLLDWRERLPAWRAEHDEGEE